MVGRQKAYHGMHYAGTSLGGLAPNTDGYGVLVPETAHVAWDDAEDLRASIERLGPDNVAGFFCEPVLGAGGVYPPPVGYLEAARKICADYEVLFVADEVITGYGRIGGAWFASTRFGLDPDMVISAKGLTSGYVPMGAVLVAPAVAEPFFRPGAGVWLRHGYTYSGHAMCAAVALANLEIIEREGLLEEAARLETTLARTLSPLAEHDAVRGGALRHRRAGGRAARGPGGCADAGGAAAGGGGRDARGRRGRHPDLTGVRDDRRRGRRAGCGHRAGGRPALTVSTAAAQAPRRRSLRGGRPTAVGANRKWVRRGTRP